MLVSKPQRTKYAKEGSNGTTVTAALLRSNGVSGWLVTSVPRKPMKQGIGGMKRPGFEPTCCHRTVQVRCPGCPYDRIPPRTEGSSPSTMAPSAPEMPVKKEFYEGDSGDEDDYGKGPQKPLLWDCQCTLTGEQQKAGTPRCEVCPEWDMKTECICGPGGWCLSCP